MKFHGDPVGLRYAMRDLDVLDRVVMLTPARRVAVQAGGHLGVWPKFLAQAFEAVYTFEPDPESFLFLTLNAPERNVFRYQAALGAGPAFVSLSHERRDGSHWPSHSGLTHVAGAGTIPTLRIDDFQFPVCDLVYLDLEGGELAALRGGVNTITRCRPILAIEINKSLDAVGVTADEVRSFIAALGYDRAHVFRSDEVFIPRGQP